MVDNASEFFAVKQPGLSSIIQNTDWHCDETGIVVADKRMRFILWALLKLSSLVWAWSKLSPLLLTPQMHFCSRCTWWEGTHMHACHTHTTYAMYQTLPFIQSLIASLPTSHPTYHPHCQSPLSPLPCLPPHQSASQPALSSSNPVCTFPYPLSTQ